MTKKLRWSSTKVKASCKVENFKKVFHERDVSNQFQSPNMSLYTRSDSWSHCFSYLSSSPYNLNNSVPVEFICILINVTHERRNFTSKPSLTNTKSFVLWAESTQKAETKGKWDITRASVDDMIAKLKTSSYKLFRM